MLCFDPLDQLKSGAHFTLEVVTRGFVKREHGTLRPRPPRSALSGVIHHPLLVHFSRKGKPKLLLRAKVAKEAQQIAINLASSLIRYVVGQSRRTPIRRRAGL